MKATITSLLLLLTTSIVLVTTTSDTTERWSRQLSSNLHSQQILNDWVPVGAATTQQQQYSQLPQTTTSPLQQEQPTDRSGNGRVLSYPQNVFAGSNQQQLQQQQRSQQQQSQFNFVHPFQFPQFKSQQPNQQPPTSQSFFKFEMPSFGLDGNRNSAPSVQTGYQIQHTFGSAGAQQIPTTSLFNQKTPVFPPEFHPVQTQPLVHRSKPIQDNYIAEQIQQQRLKDAKATQVQNNLVSQQQQQQQRPDIFANNGQQNQFQYQKPASFQSQFPGFRSPQLPQDDEVQLLYVPYDTLYPQRNALHQQNDFNNGKYNLVQEPVNPVQINNFYTQDPLENPKQNLYTTTTTSTTLKPSLSTYKPASNLQQFLNPRFTTTTKATIKPKPKPHQPPLAMFYHKVSARTTPKDVINALSSTKSVAVLDAPSKTAPDVFVGPSGLPTPSGYTRFELPYLSSFDHNNLEEQLKEAPFFVAPLSYKTPSGFEKILLPEPHVGSIVINRPSNDDYVRVTTGRPQQYQRPTAAEMYITPLNGEVVNRFSSTTLRNPTSTRLQPSTGHNRWNSEHNRGTPPPKEYYRNQYQNEAIQEVTSPRTHKKPHHHNKRPEQAFTQTVKPYAQFKPMPNNNLGNDEYFKVKTSPSTTLATTPATSSPSSTAAAAVQSSTAQNYFSETSTAQRGGQFYDVSSVRPSSRPGNFFDIVSSPRPTEIQQTPRGEYYEVSSQRPTTTRFNEISSTAATIEPTNRRPSGRPETVQHKYQSKPLFDEEYRMKQYFREQEVFKTRPPIPSTTQSNRMIEYTPVSLDYANPSSTANYFEGSTLRTTTPKFTFYHPTAQSYDGNAYNNAVTDTKSSIIPDIQQTTSERLRPTHATRLPANHRPTYDNEVIVHNHDEKPLEENDFEPNPYDLPSELPPLTPNLPGLVNALRENERLNAIDKETTEAITTTSTTLRSTRRPIANRGRRPTAARTSTSSSVSYSSSDDSTTRRPINRGRRPFNTRTTTAATYSSDTASSTTTRSSTIRNPNRVRYNPTNEERKQIRTRNRSTTTSPKKYKQDKPQQEDNIEYQRDVLKQNYPVFKHPTRKPFFTTTDKPSDDVATVTPNSLKEVFPGLLEPMQIAQQYQQQSQDNYGPGYFPNEEELNPTEPINNEIYQTTPGVSVATTTTTTTELPATTTKRSSLFRRQRPTRTTTESSATTESSSTERYTVRPRSRAEGSLPRKVIKVRARPRRPHPASTTIEPERTGKENNYQKVSRFNQDFYNDDYKNENNHKRGHVKAKFNLESQESQWSPSLTRVDSFKPINPRDGTKSIPFDNEPEIVTAQPENERKNNKNTYEFNVSAGFGPKINSYGSIVKSDSGKVSEKRLDRKTEPTFEELLEQVMSDIGREAKERDATTTTTTEAATVKRGKSRSNERNVKFSRRGTWKKVRVQPVDSFETAESQNIGTHLRNHIFSNDKIPEVKIATNDNETVLVATTSVENLISSTTDAQQKDELETTTIIPEELQVVETTTVPPTIQTRVETVTSITQEVSRTRQKVPTTPSSARDITTTTQTAATTTTTTTPPAVVPTREIDSTTTRFYNQDYEEDETIGETITRRIDENHDDDYLPPQSSDDLETQSSLFDEVRSQLKVLFATDSDDEENLDIIKPNFNTRKHEYTSIQRNRSAASTESSPIETTSKSSSSSDEQKTPDDSFHQNLMKNVVYATSTSTEVSQDTEICYRGRCIKSKKN